MDNFFYFKDKIGTAVGNNAAFFFNEKNEQNTQTPCLLCEDAFNLKEAFGVFVLHLLEVHCIIIEEVQNIYYISEYIRFWREKFSGRPVEEIVPSLTIDSIDKKFYILSTLVKEDKQIRHELRLKYLLKVQEFERTDDKYMKSCAFCKLQFEGKRQDFLHHLTNQHNLLLGNPNNLVFIEELIDKVETKFNDLICLYCEKKFPDKHTLKEHMRKKLHKRINEENKEYDKYFMVNYLEDGKDWHDIEKENDRFALPPGSNSDDEYSDWREVEEPIKCLFCEHKEVCMEKLHEHMQRCHNFCFDELTKSFTFFQKTQLINYIRRQIADKKCIVCNFNSEEPIELLRHMTHEEHFKIPEMETFEKSEFLLPTHEDDAFLYLIEDTDE